MTLKSELIIRMQDLLSDVKIASQHVEDGKEVFADRQLQGVRTKLVNFIQWTSKLELELEIPEENNVAEETSETK